MEKDVGEFGIESWESAKHRHCQQAKPRTRGAKQISSILQQTTLAVY